MLVGLVHSRGWEPPDDQPEPPRRRAWDVPWRALVWVAVWLWLLALVPYAEDLLGPLAGYAVLMAAIGLAFWRVERWCSRQYWRGLRDYRL
jgi:apolipoprotein N-acyltransferase